MLVIEYIVAPGAHYGLTKRKFMKLLPEIRTVVASHYPHATLDISYGPVPRSQSPCTVASSMADPTLIRSFIIEVIKELVEDASMADAQSKHDSRHRSMAHS